MKIKFLPARLFFVVFCLTLPNSFFAQQTIPASLDAAKTTANADEDFSNNIAAALGHCNPITVADTNCVTHTIELSAYINWIFTGLLEPLVVTWSTGEVAHKITVSPPGVWGWDASSTSCEPNHWNTDYNQPGSFFSDTLTILGPASICSGDFAELIVEAGGYNFFDYSWDPPNPSGSISPYEISEPGTYVLSVTDDLGCPFAAQINILQSSVTFDAAEQFFCPGDSIIIGGQVYTQSGTVFDTIPAAAAGDCDTIVTYTLTLLPYQTRSESISLCPGESVTIGGQVYNQSGTVLDTLASIGGCDTIVNYTLTLLPYQIRAESISFCPGESVTIGGQVYNQSGTVVDTLASIGGCDTIVNYTLTLLPYQTRSESISLCPGESVTISGQVYNQSGTVLDTLASISGCDTIVTYTLTLLPYQIRAESISFCPGKSVTISGQVYNQSGTVLDTLASIGGCDTIVTYALTLLPYQTRSESISFCPGESVTISGQVYSQPGAVVDTLASILGCDTIVTYALQFLTPAPSNVSIACPNAITVNQPGGGSVLVNYNQPTTSTDCPCPGIALTLTNGFPSGSNFPQGTTSVCYLAKDSCGQSATCCFNVNVLEDEEACDSHENGCIKYEILTITEDAQKNRTYRIRVTNHCVNKLINTAFQIPNGLLAIEPANLSTYTAPSGNTYKVRNPNSSPQYSIRYSSISDSIQLGESDIFKYTLPAQANVTFIYAVSRLAPNIFLGAHLNTFYCPIGVTPTNSRPDGERDAEPVFETRQDTQLRLFPNPANHLVNVETGGQTGELLLQDAMGRVVLRQSVQNPDAAFSVQGLPQGIYQVVFVGEKTIQHSALVVQH